ncbi:Pentatricopeptide repeat, partial [Dillenia turbinata]
QEPEEPIVPTSAFSSIGGFYFLIGKETLRSIIGSARWTINVAKIVTSAKFPAEVAESFYGVLQTYSSFHDCTDSLNCKLAEISTVHEPNINERIVLDELADLLPIRRKILNYNLFVDSSPKEQVETRAADGFLSPEEKLRGVFIQKIRGKSAIEHALAGAKVDLNVDVFAKVVNKGNLSGSAIIAFFNWAIKEPAIPKDARTYHIILKALGRRKFFDFMLVVLNKMRVGGIDPNLETLSIVIDSFVGACRISKAIKLYGEVEDLGLKRDADSLNVILGCLCRRNHVCVANSLFNSMKGKIAFNNTTHNILIGGWSKYGVIDEMERSLRVMVSDGFSADCSTFAYIIEGLGRAGQVDSAVEVFKNMDDKGCVPDVGAYNAIISCFISAGDLNESMKYYRCMLDDCDPDLGTYIKLIAAFLRTRKVADAIEVFDEMLGRGIIPTTGMITSIIKPLCSYGPPYAAMMIYKKARKVGCTISLSAYKLLLMRLSRFGKCNMMLNIWDEMQENGHSSDIEVYEYIITGLCNAGKLENAVLVMEDCLRNGLCPSKFVCRKLNSKLLTSNKVERAYKLHLKIKDARRKEKAWRYCRARGWHF